MNVDKKLRQWREAGLLDADTAERIAAFERGSERPILLYALGGLGALTVVIGLVSLVAANWDAMGRVEKLGADLVLAVGLAYALYHAVTHDKAWQTELAAFVYYGFTLASLALIGQVYQLGSPTYQGLLVWSIVTLPLMTLVRSPLLALTWLVGLLATESISVLALIDAIDERTAVSNQFLADVATSIVFASALVYFVVARLPWLVQNRPLVSATWTWLLSAITLVGTLVVGMVFYTQLNANDVLSWSVAVAAAALGALAMLLARLYPELPERALWGARALLGILLAELALGTTFARDDHPLVGAVAHLLVLAAAAWTALHAGRTSTFNVLTGSIALRILIMYFEVFGSMLSTGLGMLTGGVLTLLLAWIWKRTSPELAARLGSRQGGRHAS